MARTWLAEPTPTGPWRLCFVCLGNICRSPTAAAVMRHLVHEHGAGDRITISSAGTGGWHVGDGPDRRAAAEAARRGIAMAHVARQFTAPDFDAHDLMLAMDHENVHALSSLARNEHDRAKVRLLRSFDSSAPPGAEVPDPYYGGPEGFAEVFDLVERACLGLLGDLTA